jgi:hypothetical protein
MTWRERTTLYPDRAAWLAARSLTLGASEAAALLGESPFAGPWDVYVAKRDGAEIREQEEYNESGGVDLNNPLLRGQVLEPLVGRAYSAVTGNRHEDIGTALGRPGWIGITRHAEQPWLTASLDAIVYAEGPDGYPDEVEGCGEWKTAKDSWKWGADGSLLSGTWESFDRVVPQHIGVQALVQLAVSGLSFCDIAVLTGGLCFRRFRVLRHEPTIAALVDQLGQLWRYHIVDGNEPDLDGSAACVAECRARLAENRTKSRPADAQEAEWIEVLRAKRLAEEDAESAKARILASIGDHAKLTLPPGPRGEPHGVRINSRGAVTAF